MASHTELVLQCRSSLSATGSTGCFKDVDHHVEKMHRLEDYLKALEDERRKIEAFKRELPFCMQLLHKAIEASKEQLGGSAMLSMLLRLPQLPANSCTLESRVAEANGSSRNMMQSITPQSKRTDAYADDEGEMRQKRICRHADEDHDDRRWMTEAESCMQSTISQEKSVSAITTEKSSPGALHQIEHAFTSASKPYFHSSSKLGTGAFVPFSKDNQLFHPIPLRPVAAATNGHNVDHTAHPASRESKSSPSSGFENCGNLGHSSALKANLVKETSHNQATEAKNVEDHGPHAGRKARRSWSAELHRLFVNALMQLGGCDVATPKQIREVMNVEGLTNDEVKSHLQKYRLHSRRATLSQNATGSSSPQVVVLGGIWLPADYAAHHTSSGYGQNSSTVQQPLPVQTQAEFSYSPLSFPHGHHMSLQNTTEQQEQLSAPAHSHHGSRSEAHREESVDEGETSTCREQEPTLADKPDTYMNEGISAAEEQESFG